MERSVKFTGNFRELIPNGYKFYKLFARNYRCYQKESKSGDNVTIWQHRGGYVEINDLYGFSYLLINAILGNKPWQGQHDNFAIDMIDHVIVPYEFTLHNSINVASWRPGDPRFKNEAAMQNALDEHHRRWRTGFIDYPTIREIKSMATKGWISITPTTL